MVRHRLSFALGLVLVSVLGSLYAISSTILLSSFSQVEQQKIRGDVERALDLLSQEVDDLSNSLSEYSSWDTTYRFAQGDRQTFIGTDLNDLTFVSLDMDLIAIADASGQILYQATFDPEAGEEVPISDSLSEYLTPDALLLDHPTPTSQRAGWLLLPEAPMLVVSRPILTSDGEGPVQGSMVFGRYLNANRLGQLSLLNRLSLTLYPLQAPHLSSEALAAHTALMQGTIVFIQPEGMETAEGNGTIAGYTILDDIFGEPSLLLRVNAPRTIYHQGLLSLRYLGLSLVIVGVISGAIIVWLLNRSIRHLRERDRMEQALQQEAALRQSEEKYREKAHELEKTLRELQQTQSQLVQSEKMSSLGQLVAGVAHEINNPINFIEGNLRYLHEYSQDLLHLIALYQTHYPAPLPAIAAELERTDLAFLQQDLPQLLTSMQSGSERIQTIVLSLRNFSRLDEAAMKWVDIHEGLDSTLLLLQQRLTLDKGYPMVQVIKQYGDLPLVECYPGELNQVFMNLLANAIDALEEKFQPTSANSVPAAINIGSNIGSNRLQGAATVSSSGLPLTTPWIQIRTMRLDSHRIAVTIANNGPPIPAEIQPKLFDPFFTTKAVGQGTGLGLAISYQIIVDKHHGQLYCVSDSDKGAEFTIEIPIEHSPKSPQS